MNKKENTELKSIAKHVSILNEEVGNLKISVTAIRTDIKWIMRLMIGIFIALIVNILYNIRT